MPDASAPGDVLQRVVNLPAEMDTLRRAERAHQAAVAELELQALKAEHQRLARKHGDDSVEARTAILRLEHLERENKFLAEEDNTS